MKKTCTTIAGAMLLIATSAFSALAENPLKDFGSSKMVSVYLKATTMGETAFNKYLFAADFEHQNMANRTKSDKKRYTDFLKATAGLRYDCDISYHILDETADACIAKAVMKFPAFTRVDLITLNHDRDGWKISKVLTTYPNKGN